MATEKPPINANSIPDSIPIERTGFGSLTFVKNTVKREGNLGKDAVYLSPDKEACLKDPQSIIQFFGEKKVASILVGKLKQLAQGLFLEQVEDDKFDGNIDVNTFVQDIAAMSVRGESKKELEERRADIIEEMSEMATSTTMSDVEKGAKALEYVKELQDLTTQINAKSRKAPATPLEPVSA